MVVLHKRERLAAAFLVELLGSIAHCRLMVRREDSLSLGCQRSHDHVNVLHSHVMSGLTRRLRYPAKQNAFVGVCLSVVLQSSKVAKDQACGELATLQCV